MSAVDVLVIGAGPAGGVAATLLAREGFSVRMLERQSAGRTRLGESLLPVCVPVLQRVGLDLDELGHLRKAGADFHDESKGEAKRYPFADALPGVFPYAFQIDRPRFDEQLAAVARDAGVDVRVGEAATHIDFGRDGVTISSARERHRARYLVDASGAQAIVARKLRAVQPLEGLGKAASFVHYGGISDAAWAELAPAFSVQVLRSPQGWTWAIPLMGRRLSVGAVLRVSPIDQQLVLATVADSPLLSRLTRGATNTEPALIGDFSFANTRPIGPRYACIGDAAGFIDPVFSSGVAFAFVAAQRLADLLAEALRSGTEHEADVMGSLTEHMATAYRCFHIIAHRFYNSGILANLFFGSESDEELRRGLITVLSGEVWRPDNAFQDALLRPGRGRPLEAPWFEEPRS